MEGAFCRGLDLGGDASPGTDALIRLFYARYPGGSRWAPRVLLSVPAVESHVVRRQMRIGAVWNTYTPATTTGRCALRGRGLHGPRRPCEGWSVAPLHVDWRPVDVVLP